jgi:primosomal replication protein N''
LKQTIDRYVRRLNASLGRSALLNVAPGPKTSSRFDLFRFASEDLSPEKVLAKVLFEPPYEAILDLKLRGPESKNERDLRERLYAIARISLEKKASFIFRETGSRALWILYPVVYIRASTTDLDETRDVLSPVYLWPITVSTRSEGYGTVKIARDKVSAEPVFNRALSVWLAKTFSRDIDDSSLDDLAELTTGKLQNRLSTLFSKLGENGIDISGPLQAVPQKKDLKDGDSFRFFNSAVIGVMQWHNQELMQDLDKIGKSGLEGRLDNNPVANFLTGTPFHHQEISVPSESEQFLVRPTDYTQEQAIWQARQIPGCVIDGPPGTGKSQTIVNIVADCLAHNERILILCQKPAALNVVAKRLNAVGLQDYHLCIHDAESDRKTAIQQIKSILSKKNPGDGTEHETLSRQITELENKLDSYHSALFGKDVRIGLSYRDVITGIQRIRDGNPGIKPINDLGKILKELDVNGLDDLRKHIEAAQRYWLATDPLNNPWVNAKGGFDLDPFQIDMISETLSKLETLDQKHLNFVRKYGKGCYIDICRENFTQRLEEHWGIVAEKLKIKNMLDHLIVWAKRMPAAEKGHPDSVKQQLEESIRVCGQAKDTAVDYTMDRALGHFTQEELDSFLELAPEIIYYRKKWWRSFSSKFAGLEFRMRPVFNSLEEKFSFDRLEAIVPYLQAKIKSIQKTSILYAVFGEDAGALLELPPAELATILPTKMAALELYTWLEDIKSDFSWANKAWDAASKGVREDAKSAFKSLKIGLSRAKVAEGLFVHLQTLGQWLNESYVDMLKERVSDGLSVRADVTALHGLLNTITKVLNFRNAKRFMPPLAEGVVAILEQRYSSQSKSLDAGELNTHPSKWLDLCLVSTYLTWEKEIKNRSPILQQVTPDSYEQDKKRLKDLLNRKISTVVPEIRNMLHQERKKIVPAQWGPLLAIAGRGSKRLREVVEVGAPLGLFSLVPCWMMNPNTASLLFPLKEGYFDVVVFDEASQCPIEQAIPAIYRSKRIVVAGDEKQLPPTSFFHSVLDWEELESEKEEKFLQAENLDNDTAIENAMRNLGKELAEGVEDLLEASKPLLPRKMLKIHYRSKWPELIEFSNHAFYRGELQAPPAAAERDGDLNAPIKLMYLRDATYFDKTNAREAEEVVKTLADFFQQSRIPTIGIVTFNQPQSVLIEEKLDEYADQCDEFRVIYEEQRQRKDGEEDVGLFVKNLENVQGDERDVMIFSTTFGRKPDGRFHRYFGPINFQGGERRLNVAITRSRSQKIIITSLPLNDISPRAFHDSLNPGEQYSGRDYLQLYIRYAQAVSDGNANEAKAILDRARKLQEFEGETSEKGEPESEFEMQVKDYIERRFQQQEDLRHFTLDSQVGCKGFRIDLAVRKTDSSGYLLGIECDGKTYHYSKTARFRDVWRQDILESYGWRIHRIWSPNWWLNPGGEIDRLVAKLRSIISIHP